MSMNQSPRSAGRHWANVNEFSFLAGMRLMLGIYRLAGRWPFRLVLYPVLLWYMLIKADARKASRNYLQRVALRKGNRSPDYSVIAHFAAFAETMLDKMLLWSGGFQIDTVDVVGEAMIGAQLRSGRGAVIVCAHFGNLDLCRMLSNHHPSMSLTILVHTKHARAYNDLLASLNPDSQVDLLQVTEITPATAMLLSDRIERGGFVVVAGDRIPVSVNPRTAQADFMGLPAPFPVGPYILAGVLQCPVYMLFSMHSSDRHEVHFELLTDTLRLPRHGREQVLAQLVAQFARRLEHHCLKAPLQWFNFYDFWQMTEWNDNDASQ